MAKTIGPVERPMASRNSSVIDQSIRTCLVKGVGANHCKITGGNANAGNVTLLFPAIHPLPCGGSVRYGLGSLRISMLPAVDSSGNRIAPIKSGRGVCPGCGGEMIAKCGDTNVHHWAHRRGDDCDTWREPMTDWHLAWQECFPEECREVWVGPNREHRADVKGRGKILEVQRSSISAAEIQEREQFYGDMAWMLCGEDFEGRFKMWPCNDEDRIRFSFKWKNIKRCWLAAERNIYIHFKKGIGRVLEVNGNGEGVLEFITVDEFRDVFDDRFDPAPAQEAGKKFVPLIPGFTEKCFECFGSIRNMVFTDSDYCFHKTLPELQKQREVCAYILRFRSEGLISDLLDPPLYSVEADWFHQNVGELAKVTSLPAELFYRHRTVDGVQRYHDSAARVWDRRRGALDEWKNFRSKVAKIEAVMGQSILSIAQELHGELVSAKRQRMLCSYVKMQPVIVSKFLDFAPQLLAPEFEKYIFRARRDPDFPRASDSFSVFSECQPSREQVKELLALMPRGHMERIKKSVVHMELVAAREDQRRAEEEAERRARDREARERALRERLSWPIEKICDHLSYAVNGQASETVSLAQHVAMFSGSAWASSVSEFELAVAKESLKKFNPLSIWKS